MLNEDSLVRLLRSRFGKGAPGLKIGIGDDAAVIHLKGAAEYLAITTDVLLEDIDFRRDWLTPAQLGHKSLAANLSDLAAMGVRPRFYTVALALPAELRSGWVRNFYRGLTAMADAEGAVLIGGDLSRSCAGIQVSIAAIGETAGRKMARRSGGKAGDALFVTGVLGRSAAGLALLQRGIARGGNRCRNEALKAHRMPVPRCAAGFWLVQEGFAASMMDLSDGLSTDLPRLCEAAGAGAQIEIERLPRFEGAAACGSDPLEVALHGGEDFELLFSVRKARVAALERAYPVGFPPITRIGTLTGEAGVVRMLIPGRRRPGRLPRRGFDHFRAGQKQRQAG